MSCNCLVFFGLGCLILHDLRRVELFILVEKHPRGIEVFKYFDKYLEDISSFLDDGRDIRSGIYVCTRIFMQLELSQVVVVCARTVRRRDVTISIGGEFLIPQTRW